MKKIFISAAFALAATLSMSAQLSFSASAGFDNETSTLKVTSGNTKTTYAPESMAGFYIGGAASYELMSNVAVNAGLQFRYNGQNETDEILGIETKSSLTTMALELPVRASYLLDLGIVGVFGYCGPVFELGLVNKGKVKVGDTTTETTYYGEDGDMNRVDVRFGAGVGVIYEQVYLKCGYDWGLLNRTKSENAFSRNRGLKVGLGYCF